MIYHFTYTINSEINADNEVVAKRAVKNNITSIVENAVKNNMGNLEFKEVDAMNDSNAHDKKLVELINIAYNSNKRFFNIIVNSLALRDMHECENKGITTPIKEGHEYDYLMNVADDEDLKTIVTFVRPIDENGNIIFPF